MINYERLKVSDIWPELSQVYSGFPEDPKDSAFESILNVSNYNKQKLIEVLGLNEDGRAEIIDDVNITHTFSPVLKFLEAMLEPDEYLTITADNCKRLQENAMPSGEKVSKYLIKKYKADPNIRATFLLGVLDGTYDNIKNSCLTNLPMVNPTKVAELFDTFIQNVFSELKGLSSRKIVISVNICDIARASGGTYTGNYVSCYAAGREYSRSTVTAMIDKHIFVIANTKDEKIIGRAWMHMDSTFKKMYLYKTYGNFPEDRRNSAVAEVCARISNHYKEFDEHWVGYVNENNATHLNYQGMYYFDPSRLYVNSKDTNTDNFWCRIQLGPCVICGRMHVGSCVLCDECYSKKIAGCRKCDRQVVCDDKKGILSVYNRRSCLCAECTAKMVVCPICGKSHEKDKQCSCTKIKCAACGDKLSDSALHDGLCQSCFDLLNGGNTCEVCGAKDVPVYPLNKVGVCDKCYIQINGMLAVEDNRMAVREYGDKISDSMRLLLKRYNEVLTIKRKGVTDDTSTEGNTTA